jgi:thymidylate kinase
MAEADPQHWVVIDGGASMEEVGSSIRRYVSERLHL